MSNKYIYEITDFRHNVTMLCVAPGWDLTRKEAEIICMLLNHWSLSFISSAYCIEVNTISKHLCNIKKKTESPNLFSLAVKVIDYLDLHK